MSPVSHPTQQWSNNIETWIGGIANESQGWNYPQETVPLSQTSTNFKCYEPGFTPPGTAEVGYAPFPAPAAPLQRFAPEAWPGMWPVPNTPDHGPAFYPASPESLSSGARTEGQFSSAPTPKDRPYHGRSDSAEFFHVAQHVQPETAVGPDFDVPYGNTGLPTNTLPLATSRFSRRESLCSMPPAPSSPVVNSHSEFDPPQPRYDRSSRRASLASIKTKMSTSQKRLSKTPSLPKTTNNGKSGAANFINYTPNDGDKIVTSVTPSGSSKTTARRGKEAAERRKNLISSIVAAVWELDQFLEDS